MDRALHPNLARVAAAYDEILAEYRQGVLPPPEARRRVLALVARDDNGLEWSIDPETGRWQYRTHWGELLIGDPPAYGVVGLTPAALGAGNRHNRDQRVSFYEVDQAALYTPGSLRGSTSAHAGTAPAAGAATRRFVLAVAAAVVAAVTALLLVL